MEIAPAGDRAQLVTLGSVTARELHAAAAAVRELPGVIACIPGHSSLYVIGRNVDVQAAAIRDVELHGTTHEIPVHFDGEDVAELLARTRQSLDEFITRVTKLRLTARYLGFRGGFAYLDGWPEEWAMPRRPTSRPVRRGAFAIAGNVAGFYPIDTPGGWNVLGHTDVELEHRIAAGDEIVLSHGHESIPRQPERNKSSLATWVTPEDWSQIDRGIPPGGPFDDVAAALTNEAAGKPPDAPLLECPLVAPLLQLERRSLVAWFDGELTVRECVGEVAFGRVRHGLRGYLAVNDGTYGTDRTYATPIRRIRPIRPTDRLTIHAIAGPHDIGLRELECEVTPRLDRVGIRLTPTRKLEAPADLPSYGMQCGTMQLHPDGSVVVMGPDHPVTGGYLQPMTVISSERWKLAQLAPGERVRFVAQPPYE